MIQFVNVFIITLFVFIIFIIFAYDTKSYLTHYQIYQDKTSNEGRNLLFDYCNLPTLDPWDASILKFLKPETDPLKGCLAINQKSKLKNNKLYIFELDRSVKCSYRCLLSDKDVKLITGPWITVVNGTRIDCDVIEVECKRGKKVEYQMLHAAVVRPQNSGLPSLTCKPDVHLVIIDSVSSSHFTRAMPKTLNVLKDVFGGVNFKYLNKVGLNSQPNSFPLLFGKSVTSIPPSPFSKGHPSDYPNDSFRNPLDNDQFIAFSFQESGYVTSMSEDYARGVFNSFQAKGFEKQPTHHYLRPYFLRTEAHITWRHTRLEKLVFNDSCRESFHTQMEYLQSFIDAYPDRPQFSLTWISDVAHDNNNNLYHADSYFHQFFKNNVEKLRNSFIIVMADHGGRIGKIRETKLGEKEDSNPGFIMAVPEKLRGNQTLMTTLETNSKSLISHFDVYATLSDIAKSQKPVLLKGTSLFQPLPLPRTCDRLGIPFEYCLCDFPKRQLFPSNPIALTSSIMMIQKMNAELSSDPDTSNLCSPLRLNPAIPLSIEEFITASSTKVFQVYFSTLPGNGSFSGFVTQASNGTTTMVSDKISRLNRYAGQIKCLSNPSNYASYCYCKDLLFEKTIYTSEKPIKI